MPDGLIEAHSASLKPLKWEQMTFLHQRFRIPWELLVDLYSDDQIGVTDQDLVVINPLPEELAYFHDAGLCEWSAVIGADADLYLTVSLDEVRAVA